MSNRKVFKLSLITAACMAVSAPVFAGQIIGIQQGTPSPVFADEDEYKNGFDAWNLDNVNVRIVDADTKQVDVVDKTYDPTDGSYTPMIAGESFVSEVMDGVGTIMARLTGKDWPTGEPSGIKVITTDLIENQSNGRPNSCIMSTSYYKNSDDPKNYDLTDPLNPVYIGPGLETDGLLDTTGNINPTLCDSPFQTHKRFKVSALPASINDADGTANNGVDIVFNLDTVNSDLDVDGVTPLVRRYTVLQKLNNYTDKRLAGFKIELGFGVGSAFTKIDVTDADLIANLHLSVGDGTGGDFWALNDLATFSSGLFGKADPPKHPEDGFFSDARAGYNVASTDGSILTDASTIESTTPLSTNYTDLFGDWLPSTYEPKGIFYDDDSDPLTDATLVAFWGDDLTTPEVDYQWLLGNADSFNPVSNDDLTAWATDPLYSVGGIEDLLNLGLTYMVEVGDVTTISTQSDSDTFTIRMIPIVSADQSVPDYVDGLEPVLPVVGVEGETYTGTLDIAPTPEVAISAPIAIRVTDADLNNDPLVAETMTVTVSNGLNAMGEVVLTERGLDYGVFEGSAVGYTSLGSSTVTVTYSDAANADGVAVDVVATTKVATSSSSSSSSSGSGFSAYDNVSLLASILGFLGLGAWVARRKLSK